MLAATLEAHGRLDVVVHSATVMAYGRLTDLPMPMFTAVVETAVHSTAYLGSRAVRIFGRQGSGSLVVVNSLLGSIVAPTMGAYATAKWGQRALTRTLQIETRSMRGVHVGMVSPGSTNTPIYHLAANVTGRAARPPWPVVQPERVARAILRCVDRRRASISVGPANPIITLGFRLAPGSYGRLVTPIFDRVALTRRELPATPGNVFGPRADLEGLHGSWPAQPSTAKSPGAGDRSRPTSRRDSMTETSMDTTVPAEDVWRALADGRLYGSWVVGASRVRHVDANWPEVGATVQHSVGAWPLVIDDETVVLASVPGSRLTLRARVHPIGEFTVEVTLTPTATGCRITIAEDITSGPGRVLPEVVKRALLVPRNQEALRRLSTIAGL